MDDQIVEFLTETNESLEELDRDIVNLEQNPNDKDLLGKIFRLMHTIKGTCGFLGLPRLEKTAHHAENVLGKFRDGALEVTPEYVTLILESIDRIKFIVGELGSTGAEPKGDDADLIAKLDAVYLGTAAPAVKEEKPKKAKKETKKADKAATENALGRPLMTGEVSLEELEAAFAAAEGPADLGPPPKEEAPPAPAPPKAAAKDDHAGDGGAAGGTIGTQTLRVNVEVIENLMTMVSELVLTRNQLLQILRATTDSEFTGPLQRLNHVVSDLQDGVMKTRMQPIGNAWSKLPRIIRDLSLELGKKIDLEMRGQDTELDRQVLEMIKDPLTHMVRNSGDHGIEKPADRLAVGKPETGKILLDAYHEGGHIIIKIADDGKGLPLEKIKKKIIENGLASAEDVANMTPQQIQQYIFKAGFSTAEKVTSVSGRGVGMDVVRTNIERIGGSIELRSIEGKGSTFIIKIPLTLAIVSALIVGASGERFAIPQLSVRELVMISSQGDSRIEYIKGTPVFRLRDNLLPLISLATLFKLETAEQVENARKNLYIVVTQVGGYEFGIIVDRVFDTEEIVVKPVSKILKSMTLFSGNTILGDGSVIMIIDPNGIANATGSIENKENIDQAQNAIRKPDSEQKTSLLLFDVGDRAPKAVPLSLVARLENVKMANVEFSSGQMMVQYRGTLMPLIPFNPHIPTEMTGEKPVLVFADKGQSMGLIVEKIIDIVEEHIDVQLAIHGSGVLGSAIISGKATDVVDIAHFLGNVNKNWFKDHDDQAFGAEGVLASSKMRRKILLVDDSPFFRNMLTPLLGVAGYEVTTVEGPTQALKMCEEGAQFDAIISDIEMPDMNGFDFAARVKNGSRWQNTPMLALSSHANPADIERGMAVGFHNYVIKFDKDTLLNALSQTLAVTK